jgi:uncharacterized membrane protein YfcA
MFDFALLAVAAFVAGLVDAVVGGGGLIQIPAMFAMFPREVPATLLGTNKLAAMFGTAVAAVKYSRRVTVAWSTAAPAALAAFALSFFGAWTVTRVPGDFVRSLLPLILVAVAVYTYKKKDLGAVHAPAHSGMTERLLAMGVGAAIGFYDGFFGPGTGSFLIFLFVRFFGLDFLRASAASKVVNLATNVAAISFFVPTGNILWLFALPMAAANIIGSVVGTRLALKGGTPFIRKLFVGLVVVLIARMAWDTFRSA